MSAPVVGATKASDGRALREAMPDQVFLIPGYESAGRVGRRCPGDAPRRDDLRREQRRRRDRQPERPLSRGSGAGDWQAGVAGAAAEFAADLRGVLTSA